MEPRDGMPCIELDRSALREALERLRDRAGFESMTFVTAIDRMPAEPRFEVCHQLWSLSHSDRVRVKTRVPEHDPSVPSCVDLWPGAAFMERECFDMFGVRFDGHPGLKRLLMPEEYGHHPLRKDFPHQGIEPDRLYREWDRERRREWAAEEAS
ncbi:MAG: NADH-quinone oxidoreductase subunit C [Planctomycetota bacterium]|nr:NADH-quinone oxidoreductase subunit C [Planctomycetota bacterium]